MNRVFTAWGDVDSGIASTLVEGEGPPRFCNGDIIPDSGQLLWRIEVGSAEEACAIRNLRNGWEPFAPIGEPQPCPNCGALHYPQDSGHCWRCEHKC